MAAAADDDDEGTAGTITVVGSKNTVCVTVAVFTLQLAVPSLALGRAWATKGFKVQRRNVRTSILV